MVTEFGRPIVVGEADIPASSGDRLRGQAVPKRVQEATECHCKCQVLTSYIKG